jgi:response regulator RpfG family c-di-GMP phosphodiesterase
MIARHHERLDGSGYPAGLQSSELTSTERPAIVARLVELTHRLK